jgi:hypothetical protein
MEKSNVDNTDNLSNQKLETNFINKNISFYSDDYVDEFPVGRYFIDKYSKLPSSCVLEDNLKLELITELIGNDYKLIWVKKRFKLGSVFTSIEAYEKHGILVLLSHLREKEDGVSVKKRFYSYDDSYDEEQEPDDISKILPNILKGTIYYTDDSIAEDFFNIAKKYISSKKTKSKISLLISTKSGFSTLPQKINNPKIDIKSNYGEKFIKIHDKIIDQLSESNGKGLVLLHGLPGTGKTNYIRHLCKSIDKEIIFLPPFLAENMSSPDFIPFLLDHTNSILIIEDAEKVILDREGEQSSRQSVANILNMTDGILSDCLSIQIIATFNTTRDRIDKALLRKGRLIAEWKFDALSVDDSNNLLRTLGKNHITNKPLTLSEIYNIEEELNVVQKETNQIGFLKNN